MCERLWCRRNPVQLFVFFLDFSFKFGSRVFAVPLDCNETGAVFFLEQIELTVRRCLGPASKREWKRNLLEG